MNAPDRARRRFIGITAAASALALTPGLLRPAGAAPRTQAPAAPEPLSWRGVALGADAELRLYHPDSRVAQQLLSQSLAEVHRLERVFSLYRADSALATLNRQGYLDAPPADLVRLLGDSVYFGQITAGAFDLSVQPLWQLYADHYSRPDADPAGPAAPALRDALARVDYRAIRITPQRIQLQRPGMALTLNGIAQGYITDRITELLRAGGLDRALVDLGEIRGLHTPAGPDAAPWRVGLAQPQSPDQVQAVVELRNQALATSGGYGTPLDLAGRHTHLFDPHTGSAQPRYRSVSVLAANATTADALSTAFSNMSLEAAAQVAKPLGASAWFVLPDGSLRQQAPG